LQRLELTRVGVLDELEQACSLDVGSMPDARIFSRRGLMSPGRRDDVASRATCT